MADEEGEQVEEEKEKTPRTAEPSRGENCGITAEDLDFGMEDFEEAVAEPKIAEDDKSESDSLEELLDQLSDGN